jgi:E3 ubiquitin-protein ligase synoviolin
MAVPNSDKVLSNVAILSFVFFSYALHLLLFGHLRPIEVEQLWERAWITGTEWLFAMSIFRDEFGPWYLTMFHFLFFGKVWGWLAEGRLDMLEQQTPPNPYLFHGRLLTALAIYLVATANFAWYCLEEVYYEARPGVMIMFVFEFAILFIGAVATSLKYGLWTYEQVVVRKQELDRREELRREARAAREAREARGEEAGPEEEDELDVHDLDLPGWEAKGAWMFYLEMTTGIAADLMPHLSMLTDNRLS